MVPGSLDWLFFLLHPHFTFFFSTLFISEKEATRDFLKGKDPTQTSVPIHVKQDSNPEMYTKIT